MTGFSPNRVAAGKSTGGQFAAKVNGEQEVDLPNEAPAAPSMASLTRDRLDKMIAASSDSNLVYSLNTLDEKVERTDAERALFSRLNAEHYKRCRDAAKGTPSSTLSVAVGRGANDDDYEAMSRSETNAYHAAYDELEERRVLKGE